MRSFLTLSTISISICLSIANTVTAGDLDRSAIDSMYSPDKVSKVKTKNNPRSIAPKIQQLDTTDLLSKPTLDRLERSGADDSIRPIAPKSQQSSQNDDGI